jgi:hypothetical protein
MAIISKGTKLGYGVYTPADGATPAARPTAYTYIPDLTGIPAMGATPTTHDVTTLDNTSKVYIKGLIDVGGNLDFPCNFTSAVIDAVDTAITAEEGGTVHEWAVEFPSPVSRRAYFLGEATMVFNESVDVDSPITGTLSIIPNSEIEWEDIV